MAIHNALYNTGGSFQNIINACCSKTSHFKQEENQYLHKQQMQDLPCSAKDYRIKWKSQNSKLISA